MENMRYKLLRDICIVGIVLITTFLCGCAGYLVPEVGRIATFDARVPLVDGAVKDSKLETKDLVLNYSFKEELGKYKIEGDVVLSDRVKNSFPIVSKFFIKINFLDAHGSVLATSDISPLVSTYYKIPDKLKINAVSSLPVGTVAIVFNYYGEFLESTRPLDSDSLEIYYFPFE